MNMLVRVHDDIFTSVYMCLPNVMLSINVVRVYTSVSEFVVQLSSQSHVVDQ